jgi:MFS superfamily sulfate permease-like transporter
MQYFFKTWKQDLPAGLVVFLVAVPLCLGIALASEAPVFSGLIAGMVGGIIVGLFSGSSIGVSGPAAGLAAIVATALHDLSAIGENPFQIFLSAVVLAGLIQIILGLIRLGIISSFFPNSVIKGMLSAIGLLILFKQIPHAVGYDADFEGDETFFQSDGHNTFSEIIYSLNYISIAAVVIFIISISLLLLWDSKRIQATVLRFIPGPLLVVIIGILLTMGFEGSEFALSLDHRVNIGISGKSLTQLVTLPDFSHILDSKVIIIAVTIAIVASVETLLSVDAANKLDPLKRVTNGNWELFAQGIGNMVSGFIGGLPITQVVVRTSANVNAGGMTKLATIIHGVLIAISCLTIPMVFSYVSFASLAAILVLVGYKLAKPSMFKAVYKTSKKEFFIFVITIIAILFSDLLKGIMIGMFFSFLIIFLNGNKINRQNFFKKAYRIKRNTSGIELFFHVNVTFLSKAAIQKVLTKIKPNTVFTINKSQTRYFSADINELIVDFQKKANERQIKLIIID